MNSFYLKHVNLKVKPPSYARAMVEFSSKNNVPKTGTHYVLGPKAGKCGLSVESVL